MRGKRGGKNASWGFLNVTLDSGVVFLWLTKKGMMRKAKGGREGNERERKKAVRGKWSDAVHSRQGDTSSSGSAGQWVKICTRF